MRGPDRLRVGLVCPYSFDHPGGVQNHVLGLAAHLRRQGHRAQVLGPGDPRRAAFSLAGAHLDHEFTSAGPAVPIRYNGSVARVSFGPRTAARVRHWLRAGDFDVVHIHEPVTPSIALLALWAADVPVVATYHTATPRSRSMRVAGEVLRPLIDKVDAGLAVSESARRVVVRHLGRDAVVIPNGFSHADFAAAAEAAAARRSGQPWRGGLRPRLTFLGRMDEPRKGLDVFLSALPAIRAAVGDLEVAVAGLGTRPLPAGCRALGAVDDAAKLDLLAGTDVFVAPHVARESFGIVLIEALAAGAQVVASALPAFADLLGTGPDALGRLFAVGDPAELARATVEALDSGGHTQPAAGEATRRYDWSVVGPAITDLYDAVAKTSR